MADQPSHWANFGDGNMGQLYDSRIIIKKRTGELYWKLLLKPSTRTIEMYNLQDELDDGFIIMEYPATECVWDERGVDRSRLRVDVSFMGEETLASRRYKDKKNEVSDSERLLRSERAAKMRLHQELLLEREQQYEANAQHTKMLMETFKLRGRVDSEDSSSEDDES